MRIIKKRIWYVSIACVVVLLVGASVFALFLEKDRAGDKAIAPEPADIPVKVYDLQEIFDDFYLGINKSGGTLYTNNTGIRQLSFLNQILPVTRLSQVSEDLVYTVYDVEKSGIGYNMYIFFERGEDYEGETAGQITKDNCLQSPEKWSCVRQVLFMNKTLSFADFSSLQIGDSVEKAEAIDPVVSIPKEEKSSSAIYFHSKHLLTDGSLVLVFNRNSTEEDFKLASIEYDENFVFYDDWELRIRACDYANK